MQIAWYSVLFTALYADAIRVRQQHLVSDTLAYLTTQLQLLEEPIAETEDGAGDNKVCVVRSLMASTRASAPWGGAEATADREECAPPDPAAPFSVGGEVVKFNIEGLKRVSLWEC